MGKKSVYQVEYLLLFIVAMAFFAHNIFESFNNVDLFHLNKEIRFSVFGCGQVLFIRDVYPFLDFPEVDIYGNPLRLNLQVYLHKVGQKVIVLCLFLFAVKLQKAFNVLAYLMKSDIPGRGDDTILRFLYVYTFLFAYDLFDYVMLYSQTPFIVELFGFMLGILYVFHKK